MFTHRWPQSSTNEVKWMRDESQEQYRQQPISPQKPLTDTVKLWDWGVERARCEQRLMRKRCAWLWFGWLRARAGPATHTNYNVCTAGWYVCIGMVWACGAQADRPADMIAGIGDIDAVYCTLNWMNGRWGRGGGVKRFNRKNHI